MQISLRRKHVKPFNNLNTKSKNYTKLKCKQFRQFNAKTSAIKIKCGNSYKNSKQTVEEYKKLNCSKVFKLNKIKGFTVNK